MRFALLGGMVVAVIAAEPYLGLGHAGQAAAIALLFVIFALRADLAPGAAQPAAAERSQVPLPAGFGRALLRRMPAPLVVIAADERLVYANPAARALLPQAIRGAHFSAMIRAPAFVDAVQTIFEDREDMRFTFAMAGQTERQFEARAAYVPAAQGGELSDGDMVIILIEDRTREKALHQTHSDFVANASHELRTPLASILGYIETLQGHAKDDAEARETFLGIMFSQASRMKRLVDDLMSLSRIELSAHDRPEDEIDLFATVAEAASALYPLASQSDVLLQIELPRDGPPARIRGDRDQIAQVAANLIDNAIKYGGPGKKVRVAPAEPDPRYPGHIGVSVTDQGPGIARQNIPRLTERFFRVSPEQSKDLGGTGLGLAITKHILARHAGALDIASTQGEGSRFTIWIPALKAPGRGKPRPEKNEVEQKVELSQ